MHFAQPYWLLAGAVIVPVLVTLLVRAEYLRSRALSLLGGRLRGTASVPSRARRWLRVAVTAAAVSMGFVALARPENGMHWETMERNGADLLLVVDTSKSMDADDVKPTRLERSKLAIRDLVQRFPGDRIGLVAFAGDAFVQSPMTLDHAALLEAVDALDTGVIARGGTNIGRGIDVAATALSNEPTRQKVMVLLTDGEDLEGKGLVEARAAGAAGITIDTVGVGTAAGELVPAHDASGKTVGVVRDEHGTIVRSHLDESGLQAIAQATHGSYRPLGEDGLGLDHLYDDSLSKLTHTEASSRTHRVYSEAFELPLALALLGVLLDSILGLRWPSLRKSGRRAFRVRSLATAAAALLLVGVPSSAYASVESAAKSYARGHFEEATAEFLRESAKNPADARAAFNAGDSAYRAGHFDVAEAAFKSALRSADPGLQQRVLYNEGDVLYRAGESQKPEARDVTIEKWKAAIQAYDGALALDSKDADARFNREFVERKLKALEEQKKEEPKENDSKDGKNDSTGSGDKGGPKNGGSGADPQSKGSGSGKDDSKPASGQQSASGPGSAGKPQGGPGSPAAANGASRAPVSDPRSGHGEPAGSRSPVGTTPAPEGHGTQDESPQLGRLSARDARALLGALRGDERRGVVHAAAGSAMTNDSKQRDW
jgi:Ca-activated chloride channel family protein